MRRHWPLFALMAMTWGASDVPSQEREPDPEPVPPPRPPREPVIIEERYTSSRLPEVFPEPEPRSRPRAPTLRHADYRAKQPRTEADHHRIAEAQARRERRQKRNMERA